MTTTTLTRRPLAPAHLWDASIASAGLTVDTASGPVDLIAIERARAGHRIELTGAEVAYLLRHLPPISSQRTPEEIDARALIAEALGITTDQLTNRIADRNSRDYAAFIEVL